MANKVDFPEFERFLGAIWVDGSYRVWDVLVKLIGNACFEDLFPFLPKICGYLVSLADSIWCCSLAVVAEILVN